MRKWLPASKVVPGHPDFDRLTALATEIRARAGGAAALERSLAHLLRQAIDDVILTAKTGRRAYEELEKTEKTYIGTRVEIELRAALNLPRGRLDCEILGQDVDIKHTMGGTWMIPTEAVDQPCLLVAADETRARCYLGLVIARPEALTRSANKDGKRSISAAGMAQVLWLVQRAPYPPNFWRTVPPDAVARIFAGASGNDRMVALFREVQHRVIGREVIAGVARQADFMRRIRADKGRGTRDRLAAEGIALLSGQYDAPLIDSLGLPRCGPSDFISIRPQGPQARAALRAAGLDLAPL